jgi:PIN domain nuclease of toxin-antitoxin system
LITNAVALLEIDVAHTVVLLCLPFHHRDPFDRMLVAQASVEQATIVSADPVFDTYGTVRVW